MQVFNVGAQPRKTYVPTTPTTRSTLQYQHRYAQIIFFIKVAIVHI